MKTLFTQAQQALLKPHVNLRRAALLLTATTGAVTAGCSFHVYHPSGSGIGGSPQSYMVGPSYNGSYDGSFRVPPPGWPGLRTNWGWQGGGVGWQWGNHGGGWSGGSGGGSWGLGGGHAPHPH